MVLCRSLSGIPLSPTFYSGLSFSTKFSPELTTLALTGKSNADFFTAGVKQGRPLE
jgi:hypothetical protein